MSSPDKGIVLAYNCQAIVNVDTMLTVEFHISQSLNDTQESTLVVASLNERPEKLGRVDTMG